jgi:hypothetical protein
MELTCKDPFTNALDQTTLVSRRLTSGSHAKTTPSGALSDLTLSSAALVLNVFTNLPHAMLPWHLYRSGYCPALRFGPSAATIPKISSRISLSGLQLSLKDQPSKE